MNTLLESNPNYKIKKKKLKKKKLRNKKSDSSFIKEIRKNKSFYAMMLPGMLFIIVMYYIPMFGLVIAFKDYNPIKGILGSKWAGLDNFKYFFVSNSAFTVTFNTMFYNLIFIITGLGLALVFAVLLHETGSKFLSSKYKSLMFFPYLLSWVVGQYILFSLLSVDKGLINGILEFFGQDPVYWYVEARPWRFILPLAYIWKNVGYFAVIFVAGITGISTEYYEAAQIDGASKFKQTIYITMPLLMPIVITLFLLQIGKIFYGAFGDWGMFYNLPMNSGPIFSTTDVIDTYVYRSLRTMNDFGMSSAVGFYQSIVGFVLVSISNLLVKKHDPDSALY